MIFFNQAKTLLPDEAEQLNPTSNRLFEEVFVAMMYITSRKKRAREREKQVVVEKKKKKKVCIPANQGD